MMCFYVPDDWTVVIVPSFFFFRLYVGFTQSWHQQLHQKGWCPLASSLWRLLIEPLWHSSSSPPFKPTLPRLETSSTQLYESVQVTPSPPSDIRRRTPHQQSLTAKVGFTPGHRSKLQTLRAQNHSSLDQAEDSCKEMTAVLQVLMTKCSMFKAKKCLDNLKYILNLTLHVTDATWARLIANIILFLITWWDDNIPKPCIISYG